ncbi:MAG: high light inducible protein [Leptolyngbyaceae cyanobacterium CRU_2_3]|nr:high light inducible protein [Leptolyngbyaceae cyanobacterium CRU_2_3]
MRSGVVTEEQGRQNIYAIEPQVYVDVQSRAGFTPYAEMLNGRLAMIGFVSMLVLEAITGHGLVQLFSNL